MEFAVASPRSLWQCIASGSGHCSPTMPTSRRIDHGSAMPAVSASPSASAPDSAAAA